MEPMTEADSARIGRLEQAVAKLEQRVDDLRGDVKDLSPLSLAVARLEGAVDRVKEDVAGFDRRLGEIGHDLEERITEIARLVREDHEQREQREKDEQERRASERRDARRSRVALIVGCSAAILAPVGTIAAAVIQGG